MKVGRPYSLGVIAACTAALLLSMPLAAQPITSAPEHSIKAAYLYNFAAYIRWPEGVLGGPTEPLAIGVFGNDVLAGELERITRDRQVQGRRIEVRQLHADDSLSGLGMLFVAEGLSDALPKLAAEARTRSVLLVSESGDALRAGSVINFLMIDHRVRFEVSLAAAEASGLTISSRLLAVAEHVIPDGGG
ncbi:MAG TPA: YfiR family protein [Woeseiaceae bacterium]|nr:YfiR family protein [Woeseiaceae bacterium]